MISAIDFLVKGGGQFEIIKAEHCEVGLVNLFLDVSSATTVKDRYDLIFTPGNSFGHMTGGFDLGVVEVFGREIQMKVLEMIKQKYSGMMPVGSAEVVQIDNHAVVYVPTMMVPTRNTGLIDPYMLMWQGLRAVDQFTKENGVHFRHALCPLFCAGTGGSAPDVALHQQNMAVYEHRLSRSGAHLGCTDLFSDGMIRYNSLFQGK